MKELKELIHKLAMINLRVGRRQNHINHKSNGICKINGYDFNNFNILHFTSCRMYSSKMLCTIFGKVMRNPSQRIVIRFSNGDSVQNFLLKLNYFSVNIIDLDFMVCMCTICSCKQRKCK